MRLGDYKTIEARYLDLPMSTKRKRAVEWCMNILTVDIDAMPLQKFEEFFYYYQYYVRYPELNVGRYYFFYNYHPVFDGQGELLDLVRDNTTELERREEFKGYQKLARGLIKSLQDRKIPKPYTTTASLVISIKDDKFKFEEGTTPAFSYSYARQLAKLLDGKKFNDSIGVCVICGSYFVKMTKHLKKTCGRACACKHSAEKRRAANPEREKKKRNLEVFFSRLRKKDLTEAGRRSELKEYLRKRNYEQDEIPPVVRRFIGED